MAGDFDKLYSVLAAWGARHAIHVDEADLDEDTPGEFDGLSVTMNRGYDPEQRCYYLMHALGSIVQYSLDPPRWKGMFDELRAAKAARPRHAERIEAAIGDFLTYEEAASDFAVHILIETGHADLIPSYTNFARADLEAMTYFHREGAAPVWPTFFADWNRRVAAGEQPVKPFRPLPIPAFHPVPMREQEIVQEQGSGP